MGRLRRPHGPPRGNPAIGETRTVVSVGAGEDEVWRRGRLRRPTRSSRFLWGMFGGTFTLVRAAQAPHPRIYNLSRPYGHRWFLQQPHRPGTRCVLYDRGML